MKIAWSVGHNGDQTGAYSPWLKRTEYSLARDVVREGVFALTSLDPSIQVMLLDKKTTNGKSSGQVLRDKIRETNEWGADIALESHFNSSSNPAAYGTETLYFSIPGFARFSKKGKILAEIVQEETISKLKSCLDRKVNDRGAKGMGDIRRVYNGVETFPRYAFLTQTKMPAIILEPLFLSNQSDCAYFKTEYNQEVKRLADAVVAALIRFKNEPV